MSEMVERMAKAIHAKAWTIGFSNVAPCRDWDQMGEEEQDRSRRLARAALEAMVEPTPAMIDAGWAASGYEPGSYETAWSAMIKSALGE